MHFQFPNVCESFAEQLVPTEVGVFDAVKHAWIKPRQSLDALQENVLRHHNNTRVV